MTDTDALLATVRDTLRANGVSRYGRYERENTYGALDALDSLAAELDTESTAAQANWTKAQFFEAELERVKQAMDENERKLRDAWRKNVKELSREYGEIVEQVKAERDAAWDEFKKSEEIADRLQARLDKALENRPTWIQLDAALDELERVKQAMDENERKLRDAWRENVKELSREYGEVVERVEAERDEAAFTRDANRETINELTNFLRRDKARLDKAEKVLQRIVDGAESNPASEVAKVAREALEELRGERS